MLELTKKQVAAVVLIAILAMIGLLVIAIHQSNTNTTTDFSETPNNSPVQSEDFRDLNSLPKPENAHPLLTKEDIDTNLTMNVPAVYPFYTALNGKHFTDAHKFGSQGRSIEDIEALYSTIDDIQVSVKTQVGNNLYSGQVFIRQGNNLDFYKVTWKINVDDPQNAYIESSSVEPIENKFYIDCNTPLEFKTNYYHCVARTWGTGEVLSLKLPYIHNNYFNLGKKINNNLFLIYRMGIAESQWTDIFIYNLEDYSLSFVDSFGWNITPAYNPNYLPEQLKSCNYQLKESYQENGCLSGYSSENWFKTNLKYVDNVSKYTDTLHLSI